MTSPNEAPSPRSVTTSDGVVLRATTYAGGPGLPILLIAGTGYGGATWPAEVIESMRAERPVIVFDHRGTGRSGSSPGAYSTRGLAEDAAAVIEASATGRVHVLGHSMGGRVAQWLALDRADLVGSLVLASSGSGRSPDGSPATRGVPYHTALGLARDGYRAHLEAQIRSTFFTPEFAAAEPGSVEWLVAAFWRSRPTLAEYLKHVVARQAHDTYTELGRIRAGTLVVVGERDTHSGGTGSHVGQSRDLAERIPGATLAEIEGLAHGLFWQWPERTLEAVQGWLPR